MGITIEVTEIEVLVAIICVLLLAIVWLLLSNRREKKAKAPAKDAKISKHHKVSPVAENHDASEDSDDISQDDDSEDKVTSVLQQMQKARQNRRHQKFLQQAGYQSTVYQPAAQRPIVYQPLQPTPPQSTPPLAQQPTPPLAQQPAPYQPLIQQPNLQVPVKKSRKEQLLQTARCILSGSPLIYQVPVVITKTVTEGIEKAQVGKPTAISKPTRVFMAVGATGAGKSTLINGMVNYLLGVEFEDDFRFKLITDEIAQSQAHSQTQKITAYTIYWHEDSPVDYNLVIVDTPGFGDTRGLQRDKQITNQIKDFFSLKGDAGIDQIHGIGFVTQSALARLTHTQKYVFDSVLSVFGKDIKENIFIMATFADNNVPAVKGAIKEAKIPYCQLHKFNNEPLFASKTDDDGFNKLYWKMVYCSFKEFFNHFTRTNAVSLQLTRAVLEERQNLEIMVAGLQQRINNGIKKIDELNQEEQILRSHEADILKSKDFTYTVTTTKHRKIDISGQGRYVTNCQTCNFTCHPSCVYANDGDKHMCAAMDGKGSANACCTVCPGHCHWTLHHNNPYYFETYEEDEMRTSDDLKKRFQDASAEKSGVEGMISKLEKELEDLYNQVFVDIRDVRKCLQRLSQIALKPNPLSDADYIELLIQAEKAEKKPGYGKRIEYLSEVKERAQLMAQLGDDQIEKLTREGAKSWWKKLQNKNKKRI